MRCNHCLISINKKDCVSCNKSINICNDCYLKQLKKYYQTMLDFEVGSELYFEDLKKLDFYIKNFQDNNNKCWFCLD
jgi:NifB/MoaA-like Fe-S oxidoreductase